LEFTIENRVRKKNKGSSEFYHYGNQW